MEGRRLTLGVASGLIALLLAGCRGEPTVTEDSPGRVVANASPRQAAIVQAETSSSESTLKQPPTAAGKRSAQPERPRARRDPTRPLRRPTRPETGPEAGQPEPPPPSPPPRSAPPPPKADFKLPEPDYPQAEPRARPIAAGKSRGESLPSSPQRVVAAHGLGGDTAAESELFLLDEDPARPLHHPPVVIDGWRDEQWLTVQFEVAPNGRFRVALLEGTGDPALDARALEILRGWRWKPKTVRRRPVASTEILRLKRSVTRRQ